MKLSSVLRDFVAFTASRRLEIIMRVTPAPSRNRGKKTVRPPEIQRAFDEAALSRIGFLGDCRSAALEKILAQAVATHDSQALRAIADGWNATHEFEKSSCSKINRHVAISLGHIILTATTENRIPTRWEIREFIQNETDDSFVEDSDWDHVWKQTGMASFLKQGKPTPLKFRRASGL